MVAQQEHRLDHLLSLLDRPDLLICDELGDLSFSRSGAELPFQVLADCYEQRSRHTPANAAAGQPASGPPPERQRACRPGVGLKVHVLAMPLP
jgi:hypothetical protein